jgi:hypothetical protein
MGPRGGVVTQQSAKLFTPVQFRTWPPTQASDSFQRTLFAFCSADAMIAFAEKQESWMSKRALEFVETWVSEHIYPEGSPPKVDVSEAKDLATSCRAAAKAAGISDAEIGEQFDSLTTFIAGQIQEAADKLSAEED